MMRTLYAMPASETLLFVFSPIVPATCVPWPPVSITIAGGDVGLIVKSLGDTNLDSVKSGLGPTGMVCDTIADPLHVETVTFCNANDVMPVSTTATMTFESPPATMSQAR